MDSITQAALGASVAHALWHKPLGRKAFFWGGLLGTLPDLDVLFRGFFDEVEQIYWHRGESHSIWFIMIGTLFIGWLFHKHRWGEFLTKKQIFIGIGAVFATHILIDYFTIYGTQLLAPLSRFGFAHGNLFIIDPLYTLPILFGITIALFIKLERRMRANIIGLMLSSLYALYSLGAHAYADHKFEVALSNQGIQSNHSLTMATPFNTILWRHLVQTKEGLKVGYFSVLKQETIVFEDVPQNKELLAPFMNQPNVKAIEWFSKGYWVANQKEEGLIMSDIRFGEIRSHDTAPPESWQYNFSWIITEEERKMTRAPRAQVDIKPALASLFEKM